MPEPRRGRPNKSRHIALLLRQAIAGGRWRSGTLLPGEHALCQEFSISRTCLRRALDEIEEDGLIRRCHGRGTFVSGEDHAQDPLLRRICVLLHPLQHEEERSYQEQIDRGMRQALEGSGLAITFREHPLRRTLSSFLDANAAEAARWSALLCPSTMLDPKAIDWLGQRRIPVVGLAEPKHGVRVAHVDIDNEAGGALAMQHLVDCGCRRVLVIDHISNRFGTDRVRGMRRILEGRGIAIDPALFVDLPSVHLPESRDHSADLVTRYLRDHAIDGVFAYMEYPTIGVYQAIRDCGRQVGSDVAVLHCNDYPWLSQVLHPQPSAVHMPFETMARTATDLLLEQLREGISQRRIRIPPYLIVRGSSRIR